MEPVQNSGGTFTPPEGYFQGVRAICDEYGVLLVADEVICGFGRLGYWFALRALRHPPRRGHVRQGHRLGARAARRRAHDRPGRIRVPRGHEHVHPRDHLRRPPGRDGGRAQEPRGDGARATCSETCAATSRTSRRMLERLGDKPIVGDVRGAGYFMSIELVRDKETKQTFSDEESERLLRGFLSPRLFELGPDLPRRRPRRPGDPALAAADRHPRGARLHPRRARHGAGRGLDRDDPLGSREAVTT